jgi:hypothetical protein
MRQIPYFHVIQPNQHYPTQRVFSVEEQRIIQDSPYRQAAEKGYLLLISKGEQMQKDGIIYFLHTFIFLVAFYCIYFYFDGIIL